MTTQPFRSTFHQHFEVVPADTPQLQKEVFRIRYAVYCEELGYEAVEQYPDGLEQDVYDIRSRHILLRHKRTGVFAGCVRLVFTDQDPGGQFCPLPLEAIYRGHTESAHLPLLCEPSPAAEVSRLAVPRRFRLGELEELEAPAREECGEISRLAVHRDFRRRRGDGCFAQQTQGSSGSAPNGAPEQRQHTHIPVGLYLAAAAVAMNAGLSNVFVMAEPRLVRHLRIYGIHFQQVTEPIEHRGQRCIYHINRERLMERLTPDLKHLLEDILTSLKRINGWQRPIRIA